MKSRTMLEILEIVDEQFQIWINNDGFPFGFCYLVTWLVHAGKLDTLDKERFREYLIKTMPEDHTYYDCMGNEKNDSSQYVWPLGEIGPRKEWIDIHIKKLRDDKGVK